MKFQIPINVTIVCAQCGKKLDAAFEFEGLENYDFKLIVEPCQKCGLTKRAPDVCPACRGSRYVKVGMYHESCEACNGTGKRR